MATTKTIQPTGTTITIPAMTDRPDASVYSTDIGRITDAVNALNSKLNKFKLHTQSVTTNSTGSAMLSLTTSKIILGGTLDKDGHFRLDTYNGNWWVSDLTPNTTYTVTVLYYEE